MSENKTKPTSASVADYIATLPNERKRNEAHQVLEMIKEISDKDPVMWGPSIIGFDKRNYKHGTMPLLAFSPRKTNFVFYIINNTEEQNSLLAKLGKYRTGKVCLYINKLADVNEVVLKDLLLHSWNHAMHKSRNNE